MTTRKKPYFLWSILSYVLSAELILSGCTSGASSPPQTGQMLPIDAEITINQTLISLEVARTPEQQALGLMFRQSLPDNQGMLFLFAEPRYPQFWMKNVPISLDMIFLKDGIVQALYFNVPGCPQEPCPIYAPNRLVDQAIELRGGRAQELGVQVGDKIVPKILR